MMAYSGESTKEYRAIRRHRSNLVDNLGDTVDPAIFARKLQDESLISTDIVEAASVVGILTGSQRIAPVISAVQAQIKLRANVFHTFVSVLKAVNFCLADTISEYYTCSLELHVVEVLEVVLEWKELGYQLNIDPEKLLQLSECGSDPEYCREQVVSEWLKGDKGVSWEKLCRALERMGYETEVLEIRKQYTSIPDDVPVATSTEAGQYISDNVPAVTSTETGQYVSDDVPAATITEGVSHNYGNPENVLFEIQEQEVSAQDIQTERKYGGHIRLTVCLLIVGILLGAILGVPCMIAALVLIIYSRREYRRGNEIAAHHTLVAWKVCAGIALVNVVPFLFLAACLGGVGIVILFITLI